MNYYELYLYIIIIYKHSSFFMINKHRPLYIGIHGFAGSGKDTVTKMIRTILSRDWASIEECKSYYKSIYNLNHPYEAIESYEFGRKLGGR